MSKSTQRKLAAQQRRAATDPKYKPSEAESERREQARIQRERDAALFSSSSASASSIRWGG